MSETKTTAAKTKTTTAKDDKTGKTVINFAKESASELKTGVFVGLGFLGAYALIEAARKVFHKNNISEE